MTDIIAIDHMKAGKIDFLPGDKLDLDELRKHAGWTDRLIDQLKRSTRIGEITQENFRIATARRAAGSPWPPRGFSQAYLEEGGFVDRGEAPKPAPAKAVTNKQPPVPKATVVTHVVLGDDKIAVGDYFLQPKKSGNFHFYDAADKDGRLLRDKSFKNVDTGKAFLIKLSTDAAAAGRSGGHAEKSNDGDVRSSPDD